MNLVSWQLDCAFRSSEGYKSRHLHVDLCGVRLNSSCFWSYNFELLGFVIKTSLQQHGCWLVWKTGQRKAGERKGVWNTANILRLTSPVVSRGESFTRLAPPPQFAGICGRQAHGHRAPPLGVTGNAGPGGGQIPTDVYLNSYLFSNCLVGGGKLILYQEKLSASPISKEEMYCMKSLRETCQVRKLLGGIPRDFKFRSQNQSLVSW